MTNTVYVTRSGPIWDGRFEHEVDEFCHEAAWEIAKVGRGDLGVRFIKVFREPTGYFESQVEAVQGPTHHESAVHDGGVIYSHWLEGSGSRNFPVTRFKGYWSFRIISQELQGKAVAIAERVLRPYLARMGGGPR